MIDNLVYKCCTDDVPLNAFLHSNFQCVSLPVRGRLHDIHPMCPMPDHLQLEDNVSSTSFGDGLALLPMIEAKVEDGWRHHLRVKDNAKLQTLFRPNLDLVLQPGLQRCTHDVVPLC